jgi:hypothetical protein
VDGASGTSGSSGSSGTSGVSLQGQIILTAAGSWPSITSGSGFPLQAQTTTNLVNYYYIPFIDASQTFSNWAIAMPSDYNGGTITAVFYWTTTAATGDVVWGLAGRAYGDGNVLDQAFGTAQSVTDTTLGNGDVMISTATAAITLGGTPGAASEYVQFRMFRDGANVSDTITQDCNLLQVRITYTRV